MPVKGTQEILTIWYECINTSNFTFSRSREELRSRELVKLSRGGLLTYLEGKDRDLKVPTYGVWSLRPLVKLYIEHLCNRKKEVMNSKIMSAMDSFLNDKKFPLGSSVQHNSVSGLENGDNEKAKVAIVLCALYFDHSHADRIIIDVATKARSTSNLQDCSLVVRRRQAMEPIIWLLSQPKHGKWTELGLHSARKVFLTYSCERQLDGDGFSTLLKLDAYPPAQLAALRALLSVFTVEETPLPWQHTRRILMALLALLDSKGRCSTSVQEAASKALASMLQILIRFLFQHDKLDLRLQSAMALSVLIVEDEVSIGKKIVKEDGGVADVVKSWSQHGKGDLQEQVVEALKDLAKQEGDSIKLAIVNEEGVLAALVKALVEHNNGNLQEVAACALRSLSSTDDQSIRSKIGNEKGAIASLVNCLSGKGSPALQEHATAALANLAKNDGPNKVGIANESGALAALVKLLLENHNDGLQGHAARCLWCLVSGNGEGDWNTIRSKVADERGAIAALVKSLSTDGKPYFQENAIGVLTGLASGDEFPRQAIVNEPRALAALVKLMLEHNEGVVQGRAALVISNLASGEGDWHSIRIKILNENGALAALVKALYAQDNPYLQETATKALASLACGGEILKQRIVDESMALAGLMELLSEHSKSALQQQAARALRNLTSSTDHRIRVKIGCEKRALACLVECLSKHDNLHLQTQAVYMLRNLALTKDNKLKVKIRNEKGLLTALISLSQHDNWKRDTGGTWGDGWSDLKLGDDIGQYLALSKPYRPGQ